jgi:hypothetical protein
MEFLVGTRLILFWLFVLFPITSGCAENIGACPWEWALPNASLIE